MTAGAYIKTLAILAQPAVNHVGIQPVAQRYRCNGCVGITAGLKHLCLELGTVLAPATLFVSMVSTCLFRGHYVYSPCHQSEDGVAGRAYNRTQYIKQKHRTEMMQRWADYLGKLRRGADLFELPRQVE